MTYGQGLQAYTHTQVSTTTSQKKLIVMAYDGVLQSLNQAKEHMARGEIEPKYRALYKARAILEELAGTLNMEQGGVIAQNLWNLYMVFMHRIGEANVTNRPEPIDAILPPLRELREGWDQLELPEDDAEVQQLNRRMAGPEQAHRLSVTG
ncbi:MAG: hypothetical protein Kow0092_05060 [Deferrisomatales bacterium]